jgi:hypothetical protein
MNQADIDSIAANIQMQAIVDRGPALELRPDVRLRLTCLELALGGGASCASAFGQQMDSQAYVAVAQTFYQFLIGETHANLHSPKQDER